MIRRASRIALALLLAGFPLLAFSPPASAVHGSLKQQILPLECIFQIVNDGSNTIVYITPEECGVVIPPPDPVNPIDPVLPTIPGQTGTPTSPTRVQSQSRPVAPQESTSQARGALGSETVRLLPFRPVANNLTPQEAAVIRDEVFAAIPGAAVIVTITALGLVVLVSII